MDNTDQPSLIAKKEIGMKYVLRQFAAALIHPSMIAVSLALALCFCIGARKEVGKDQNSVFSNPD